MGYMSDESDYTDKDFTKTTFHPFHPKGKPIDRQHLVRKTPLKNFPPTSHPYLTRPCPLSSIKSEFI